MNLEEAIIYFVGVVLTGIGVFDLKNLKNDRYSIALLSIFIGLMLIVVTIFTGAK